MVTSTDHEQRVHKSTPKGFTVTITLLSTIQIMHGTRTVHLEAPGWLDLVGAREGRLVRRRAAVKQTAALARCFEVTSLTRATILIAHYYF